MTHETNLAMPSTYASIHRAWQIFQGSKKSCTLNTASDSMPLLLLGKCQCHKVKPFALNICIEYLHSTWSLTKRANDMQLLGRWNCFVVQKCTSRTYSNVMSYPWRGRCGQILQKYYARLMAPLRSVTVQASQSQSLATVKPIRCTKTCRIQRKDYPLCDIPQLTVEIENTLQVFTATLTIQKMRAESALLHRDEANLNVADEQLSDRENTNVNPLARTFKQ